MTPRRRTLKGTTAQLAESDGWFCPRSSLRFFLFKTARLLFLESALTNSLYCSDFQIASHWPPNDARVTDVGSRAVCTGPLPTIPCTVPSLRATRRPAPQRCLFRDPSQAFVYTGEHSGEPSIPVLPNPTLLSGVSDGNATSPSKPSLFYQPHVVLSISLVGRRVGASPPYTRLYLSQQTTNPWRAGAMSYHTASRPRIGAREGL